MKSLAELQAIKDKMKDKVILREGTGDVRVVVGMAACGIAAGARPVLNTFVEEVNKADLNEKVSANDATATMFMLDIMVIQALSALALPITQLKRSPMYTPLISLSPSGRETGLYPDFSISSFTVIAVVGAAIAAAVLLME